MGRKVITTEAAPEAVGAYSQAIDSDGLIFCSGQIPLEPATGELVTGPIGDQARRCLDNLAAVLEAAGSSLGEVVKVTILLGSIEDFGAVNDVYAGYFTKEPPARAAYAVAGLPKGAGVEIECVARRA